MGRCLAFKVFFLPVWGGVRSDRPNPLFMGALGGCKGTGREGRQSGRWMPGGRSVFHHPRVPSLLRSFYPCLGALPRGAPLTPTSLSAAVAVGVPPTGIPVGHGDGWAQPTLFCPPRALVTGGTAFPRFPLALFPRGKMSVCPGIALGCHENY